MAKTTQDYITEVNEVSAHNYHPIPVVIKQGQGVWVTDVEGKKYIDMLSAYSALNQGHNHPKLADAIRKQLDTLTLTSRAFHNDQMGPFLKKLTQITGFDKALPMNTGAEAVETALKTARRWGYEVKGVEANKAEIIVCQENFHGRTTTIIGFSTSMIDTQIVGNSFRMMDIRTRQDAGLWITLLGKGFLAYGLDKVLVRYRIHSNSISANKIKAAMQVWNLYFNIHRLGFFKSAYCFAFYLYNAIKKRI